MRRFAPVARDIIAETIGTFILVFIGTGAVVVDRISQGAITHLGISSVFGAIVAALIYTLGHISGAHFNPAVTLAFWGSGFFPGKRVVPYIVGQCVGAIAASGLLRLTFGIVGNLGATLPLGDNWLQALILETVLTFILMFVIFGSGLDRRAPIGSFSIRSKSRNKRRDALATSSVPGWQRRLMSGRKSRRSSWCITIP